jgi:hypothetical protein
MSEEIKNTATDTEIENLDKIKASIDNIKAKERD